MTNIILKNLNGKVFGKWMLDAENLMDAVNLWKSLPFGVTTEVVCIHYLQQWRT